MPRTGIRMLGRRSRKSKGLEMKCSRCVLETERRQSGGSPENKGKRGASTWDRVQEYVFYSEGYREPERF